MELRWVKRWVPHPSYIGQDIMQEIRVLQYLEMVCTIDLELEGGIRQEFVWKDVPTEEE